MNFKLIQILPVLACLLFGQLVWASGPDPQSLIKDTTEKVLAEIVANKAELEIDPKNIFPIVEKSVVTLFDFKSMSRLALGKHWKRANENQQNEFVDAFRQLLIRTYSTALLGYSGETINYPDYELKKDAKRTMVPTEFIAKEAGQKVAIDYSLYRKADIWKVYDIKVGGLSLISNYRTRFADEIRKHKIDGLIAMLQKRNKTRTDG